MSNARDTAKNLKTGLNVAADGSIIDVQKNGTTVGSVGTNSHSQFELSSSAALTLEQNSTTTKNLYFSDTTLSTFDGSQSGTVDLGRNVATWKDLYLGGGVYLGGTGAANKLEDYEEGTWTPTVGAVTGQTQPTVTAGTFSGGYTKIGSVVVASFYVGPFQFNSTGSGSTLAIKGFPFSGDPNIVSTASPANAFYYITFGRPDFVSMRHYTANEFAFLSSNNGGNWGWESCSVAGTGSSRYIIGSMTYLTAS
tara:strand:+ start:443 stop:1198 length:756 start_codon:yes stop_codon:yes gene_type:complete